MSRDDASRAMDGSAAYLQTDANKLDCNVERYGYER